MSRSSFSCAFLLLCASSASAQGVVTIFPDRDGTLYSESGSTANGAGMHVFTGRNSAGDVRRALVHFDVTSALPPGSMVTDARLVLHLSQQSSLAEVTSVAYVISDWGEGVSDAPGSEGMGTAAATDDATWSERYFGLGLPWMVAPGGDIGPTLATASINGVGDWTFAGPNLTSTVASMAEFPFFNYGLCVLGNEAAAGTAKRFDSRENPTAAFRPRLIVTYSMNCSSPVTACFGAVNSTGLRAPLVSSGSTSVFTNNFRVHVSGAPANTNGTFFFGTAAVSVPFGDGTRCAGGTLQRFGTLATDASGAASRQLDFTIFAGSSITPGQTFWFQFAYRDVAAGGAGFNASDTLAATFCP